MENETRFDLNEALHQWREIMSASPSFRAEDLDQLESHLRDSVAALQTKGLSEREAFWVAKSRMGTDESLNHEFGKVNVEKIWLNRVFWMVIGSLAIREITVFVSTLTNLVTSMTYRLTNETRLIGAVGLVVYIAVFAGLLRWFWRSGKRSGGLVWQIGGWMKTHPVAGALAILLFSVFIFFFNLFSAKLLGYVPMLAKWRSSESLLLMVFWPLALAWLLVNSTRKPIFSKGV